MKVDLVVATWEISHFLAEKAACHTGKSLILTEKFVAGIEISSMRGIAREYSTGIGF